MGARVGPKFERVAEFSPRADIPCAFEGALGEPRQLHCLGEQIPGFGGFFIKHCKLIAHLTHLDREPEARKIIELLLSESLLGKIYCPSATTVEIRQGQYDYVTLEKWESRLSALMETGAVQAYWIDLERNRIGLSVRVGIARVTELLKTVEVPREAVIVTNVSDQSKFDTGLLQYIKLPIEKEFVFPAVLWTGERKGELRLGRTSLAEALQIVPPWHGHGPTPPTRTTAPGKVGKVLQKVKTGYNPGAADFILLFDEHEKLAIIQLKLSSSEAEQKMIRKILVEYQFQKVADSEAVSRMQGDIAPCITLDVFVPKMADSPVADMGFVFTCATD